MLDLKLCCILIFLFIKANFASVEEKSAQSDKSQYSQKAALDSNAKIHHETSENKIYEQLLRGKIKEQSVAIKSILTIKENNKQIYLLNELLKNINKVMVASQKKLQSKKYTPKKQHLPSDNELRESSSIIIENTAFISELSLYFPDFIKKNFAKDANFRTLYTWAYNFSKSFSFYDAQTTKMLNLAAQELEIIQREDNFKNPYKQLGKSKEDIERNALDEIKRNQEKKKEARATDAKKKRNKAPSLTRKIEL